MRHGDKKKLDNREHKGLEKKHNLSVPEVEKYWLKAKTAASDTLDPSSPDFYALVVGILKKMLKNKKGSKEEEMSAYERRRKIREIKREARRRVRQLRRGGME